VKDEERHAIVSERKAENIKKLGDGERSADYIVAFPVHHTTEERGESEGEFGDSSKVEKKKRNDMVKKAAVKRTKRFENKGSQQKEANSAIHDRKFAEKVLENGEEGREGRKKRTRYQLRFATGKAMS